MSENYVEPVEVEFLDGPLEGSVLRMVIDDDVLIAWAHKQSLGIVQVTDSDGTRQEDLWQPHTYCRVSERPGYLTYRLCDRGGDDANA